MKWLSDQEHTTFLGQGITCGDRFYGTLNDVPLIKCIEFPVAENLIMGSAIGITLKGYRPIVLFQRMDFMLIAADQIINHLALMPKMSGGQFKLPLIIRACIGSKTTKFDVGMQHRKNFKFLFEEYIKCEYYKPGIYQELYGLDEPFMIVEEKDSYDNFVEITQ